MQSRGPVARGTIPDALERALDEAGIRTAHLVGNSLGGYVALQLAARGRARSVVALAPAGGWAVGDESYKETLSHFITMQELLEKAVPHVDADRVRLAGVRESEQRCGVRGLHT